jgi:superfamily II DNA or RNA helicase
VSVVGLTATPFRLEYLGDDAESGTKELKEIFLRLIEPRNTPGENPRLKLQEMGVLARPIQETIETRTAMRLPVMSPPDSISEEELERLDRILAVQTDKNQRRLAILERLVPIAKNEQNSILYFGPTVRDAECMAYLLRREAIPADVISGDTRDVTRRRVVAEFKQKKIRVLCNCQVLRAWNEISATTSVSVLSPLSA